MMIMYSPILVLWGISIFVFWFFKRQGHISRVRHRAGQVVISLLFSSLLTLTWYQHRPPFKPTRIGIFPFVNEDGLGSISWESIAFADLTVGFLKEFDSNDYLTYNIQWLWDVIQPDSLAFPQYTERLAKAIKLDYVLRGSFINEKGQFKVALSFNKSGEEYQILNKVILIDSSIVNEVGHTIGFEVATVLFRDKASFPKGLSPGRSYNSTRHFYQGWLAFMNGRYLVAHQALEQHLTADSNSVKGLNLQGEIYLTEAINSERPERAFTLYQKAKSLLLKAARKDSNNALSLRLLGETYLQNKKWNEAWPYLKNAYEKDKFDSKTYVALSRHHQQRYEEFGFKTEAELLSRAIFINPCDLEARFRLAELYRLKNRLSQSREQILEFLKINSNHVDGLMALGQLYLAEQDLLNVLETYEKVVKLDPGNADAFYNLGIASYYQQDYDVAVRYFKRAITLSGHPDSHLYLAYISEAKGDTAQAIEHLRLRIRKRKDDDDPFYKEAREHLYGLMVAAGKMDSIRFANQEPDSDATK